MKFALVLSGCGQHDGSETHEVILTLLSLSQQKIEWDAYAPDIDQHHVTNHVTNEIESGERRSVLKESARLVRGKIKPIIQANVAEYDAVIFPGGNGAVSTLCNWAERGEDFSFQPEVKTFIDEAIQLNKPVGFICIAPIMISKLYSGAQFTIGHDETIAKQIRDLGGNHVNCEASHIVVDTKHQIVSTPANMVAKDIDEVYEGIRKLVQALAKMVSAD